MARFQSMGGNQLGNYFTGKKTSLIFSYNFINENLHFTVAQRNVQAGFNRIFGCEFNQKLIYLNVDSSETHINTLRKEYAFTPILKLGFWRRELTLRVQ